jgi:hypothetical protein
MPSHAAHVGLEAGTLAPEQAPLSAVPAVQFDAVRQVEHTRLRDEDGAVASNCSAVHTVVDLHEACPAWQSQHKSGASGAWVTCRQ